MTHEIGHRNVVNIPRSERGERERDFIKGETRGESSRRQCEWAKFTCHVLVPSSATTPSVAVQGDRLTPFARVTLSKKEI